MDSLGFPHHPVLNQFSLPHPPVLGPDGRIINGGIPLLPLHGNFISPIKGDIFKLCENHPRMKDCICAAYPNSIICQVDYCLNHPNFYECSPNYCNLKPYDAEACKCKFDFSGLECRCKLNPLSKECFCLKYPNSKFCLPDFCGRSDNINQIFCLCSINPFSQECRPAYCHENKYDSRCKCLLNPDLKECLCYMNPSNIKCKNFNYETNSFNEHEDKKNSKINNENSNVFINLKLKSFFLI